MRLAVTIAVDDPVAFEEPIALACERIRTAPSCRPGSVAANVLWDVGERYRLHRRIERPDHDEVGEGDGRQCRDLSVCILAVQSARCRTTVGSRCGGVPAQPILSASRWRRSGRLTSLPAPRSLIAVLGGAR